MPKPFVFRAAAVFFCLLPALMGALHAQNTQLSISAGTTLGVAGNHLVLNNTDLRCNGSLNAPAGTVWVTGNANSSFTGAGTPLIGTLQMDDAVSSDTLTLACNLQIGSLVNFQQGMIALNGRQVQLMGSAVLQGESETSHFTAITGGSVSAGATGVNSPNALNVGNLGAVLTSGSTLGNLTVSRSGKPAINPANSGYQGIDRSFLIQPQNDNALNATLRFYYLNAELNGRDPSTLSLWSSADGITWIQVGADTRDATNKYVEKTGINTLSLWTLSDLSDPLPLTLISFSAACENNYALIQWRTGTEGGLDYFLVQGSTDGSQWTTLDKAAATNAAQGSAYAFQDTHPSDNSFYRLLIQYQSGEISYSPVFRGGCSDVALPFTIYPNPAASQALAQLSVRQNTLATLQVVDISGKTLYRAQWNLQPGINTFNLPISALAAGSYIVNVYLPNSIQQAKLIKN